MEVDFSSASPIGVDSNNNPNLSITDDAISVDFNNVQPLTEQGRQDKPLGLTQEVENIPEDPLEYGFQLKNSGTRAGSRIYSKLKEKYPDISEKEAVDIAFRDTSLSKSVQTAEKLGQQKMAYAQGLNSSIEDIYRNVTETEEQGEQFTRGQYQLVGEALKKEGIASDYNTVDGSFTTPDGATVEMKDPSFLQSLKVNGYEALFGTVAGIVSGIATRSPKVGLGAGAVGAMAGKSLDLLDIEEELGIKIDTPRRIKKIGLAGVEDVVFAYVGGKGIEYASQYAKSIYNTITDPALKKVLLQGEATLSDTKDYFVREFGVSEEEVGLIEENYRKLTAKGNLTEEEKIKALVLAQDEKGAVRTTADFFNEDVLTQLRKDENAIVDSFLDSVNIKGGEDLQYFSNVVRNKLDGLSQNYGDIKNAIIENYSDIVKIKPEQMNAMKKAYQEYTSVKGIPPAESVIEQLDKGVTKGLDFDELIKLRIGLGQATINTAKKGTNKQTVGSIKGFIDDLIYQSVKERNPADADVIKELWQTANKGYASKQLLELKQLLGKSKGGNEANWISNAFLKMADREMSTEMLPEYVGSVDITKTGSAVFNQLKEVVGQDAMENIEKSIIKASIDLSENELPVALKNIKGFDFSTEAGQQLKKRLQTISDTMPTTKLKNIVNTYIEGNTGGIMTDNLIAKARWFGIGKIWKKALKRTPFGAKERIFEKAGDALKTPISIADLQVTTNDALKFAFEEESKILKKKIKYIQSKKLDTPNIKENNDLMIERTKLVTQLKQLQEARMKLNKVTPELEKKARTAQLKTNRADLTVQKAEERIDKMEGRLTRLSAKYNKKPSSELSSEIQRLTKDIELSEKDLSLKRQTHSKAREEFDSLGVDVEKLNEFSPELKPVTQPKVTSKTE